MDHYRVLVIGGYGFFGRRLVERLARQERLHVTVAGRSARKAEGLVAALRPKAMARLDSVELDAMADSLPGLLGQLRPGLVIHTSGPFQGQDYRVALACMSAGAHYVDLADGRAFVQGIGALDAGAKASGVLVTSGASSVPSLSSAVVDRLARGLREIKFIDIGISPGNKTERGLSTVAGILSYCGKALPASEGREVFGWSGAYRHRYPAPVGSRLLSPCDVPDLALLPGRYAGQPTVRFGAGLELEFLHHGMNLMAWLARIGLVRDWSAYASLLKRAADLFKTWGSDAGAMHVSVSGTGSEGTTLQRHWALVATDGDGPYVPTLAASALARKLAAGTLCTTGAVPCMGLLSLEDFEDEAQGLKITMTGDPA
ncbi:saccharopine dehydrogenase NADP-binding domain-containing protein [Variovorax robiniae]|uniref:Saccharopine dehydrogenase NADP-binding domain-containing protein n=1 Tax=Variovorax robiniae TaxID=1836199 RepID=A0ABU8X694_9BURK